MTTHITRRFSSVAGKSFSPLGVGAGERRPSCSHYPKPRGMSFNPLGGGAGAWDNPTIRQLRRREEIVSIPSEVGRGRAPSTCRRPWSKSRPAGFNPLGGWAGSGSEVLLDKAPEFARFQSPRRWGGVGLFTIGFTPCRTFRSFNPLGGGAGSGPLEAVGISFDDIPEFQSPRRWGGVGLHVDGRLMTLSAFRFNPLGGGAGSGSWHDLHQARVNSRVSIPSEVGRGRAHFQR